MKLAKEINPTFDDAARPLTARELFAGDEDLYGILEHDGMPCSVSSQPKQTSEVNTKSTAAPQKHKFSYIAGIAIRISIGLIAAMLIIPISLYCIMAIFAPKHRSLEEPVIVRTSSGVTTQNSTPTVPTRQEAISWKLAQSYYQQKDYTKASAAYRRLGENLTSADPTQAIWDGYLKLKQALCAYRLKDTVTSEIFFNKALQSSSPVTVGLANYYLSFIKNEQKLYSDARLRAYKALALLETIDSKYSESLISDCTFLVAQTLTQKHCWAAYSSWNPQKIG